MAPGEKGGRTPVMLQLSHLPPPAIFEHSESLHAITLSPLASFLAHLSSPGHLRTLHEILEKYRTPDSYHRIDVREIGSSEIPIDPELEDPIPTVAQEGGVPIILEAGHTRSAYRAEQEERQIGAAAARQLAAEHPDLLTSEDDPPIPALPHTFAPTAHAPPVHPLPPAPQIDPSLLLPHKQQEHTALYPLPPTAPLRRVRELRLDLRTLDAAALFALETWRRAELGLEKLDMEIPQSIWYKEPTPSPPPPPKRKPGRPRKSVPHAPPADSSRAGTVASETPIGIGPTHATPTQDEADATLIAAIHSIAREDQISIGPSEPAAAPSPDEIRPDAYNETERLDPSFVPEHSPAPSSTAPPAGIPGVDGAPRRKRGRPSKAELEARTTYLPDGTAVIASRPKMPPAKKGRGSLPVSGGDVFASHSHVPSGSGGTSTPSTDPAWDGNGAPSASGKKSAGRNIDSRLYTNTQAVPLAIPPLPSPSRPSQPKSTPQAPMHMEDNDMLNPDGSMKLSAAPPPLAPPPPPAASTQTTPTSKKRGRPPKARNSLDPFGAERPSSSTPPSAGLPPQVLQRITTLQEALASSSSSQSLVSSHATPESADKETIANAAARIVADIGPSPLATASPGAKGKGKERDEAEGTPTNANGQAGKKKKRKSMASSADGDTPSMSKRRYMTKEFKEYAEEWAFLKGF